MTLQHFCNIDHIAPALTWRRTLPHRHRVRAIRPGRREVRFCFKCDSDEFLLLIWREETRKVRIKVNHARLLVVLPHNENDKAFAACFANSSNGHALYPNESANAIRPGLCGYFDQDGKVTTTHDAQPIDVLEDWVKANLGSIMKTPHARTVKKKGLWIVTKTFTSKKRAVAVMQSSGQSVALGVDASIPNLAKVGPSMKWWETMVDKPGWKAQVDDDGVVLFMIGLYWKPWLIVKSLHVKREKERQTFLGVADGIDAV
ncbi:hypothetical protein V8F06_003304 [Rhypophila decipiens]